MSSERPPPTVITISASFGSGGSLVGPRVAQRVGVPFVDRAIPVAVSARLAVPLDDALAHEEPPHRTLGRLLPHFASSVQMFAGAPPESHEAEDETFQAATEQVVRGYAETGGVILGRAAAVVLRDFPHVLHVRLDAPRERRVVQTMRVMGMDRATVEEQLRAADLSREAYVRHWYHVDPRDPSLYHLVIDATSIALDACAELIAVASASRLASDPE